MQIPRLYAVYKEQGIIETFEQMLDNIFTPLFEVTKDPTTHPQLHLFLKQVGFRVVLQLNCTTAVWQALQSDARCAKCPGVRMWMTMLKAEMKCRQRLCHLAVFVWHCMASLSGFLFAAFSMATFCSPSLLSTTWVPL